MLLGRIEVPKRLNYRPLSLKEYIEAAKSGNSGEIINRNTQLLKVERNDIDKKKPVLSLKNILLFCSVSILGGYALRNFRWK